MAGVLEGQSSCRSTPLMAGFCKKTEKSCLRCIKAGEICDFHKTLSSELQDGEYFSMAQASTRENEIAQELGMPCRMCIRRRGFCFVHRMRQEREMASSWKPSHDIPLTTEPSSDARLVIDLDIGGEDGNDNQWSDCISEDQPSDNNMVPSNEETGPNREGSPDEAHTFLLAKKQEDFVSECSVTSSETLDDSTHRSQASSSIEESCRRIISVLESIDALDALEEVFFKESRTLSPEGGNCADDDSDDDVDSRACDGDDSDGDSEWKLFPNIQDRSCASVDSVSTAASRDHQPNAVSYRAEPVDEKDPMSEPGNSSVVAKIITKGASGEEEVSPNTSIPQARQCHDDNKLSPETTSCEAVLNISKEQGEPDTVRVDKGSSDKEIGSTSYSSEDLEQSSKWHFVEEQPCSRITPQGNGFLARVKTVILLLCLPANILVVVFFVVPELIFGSTSDSSEHLELGSKRHFVEEQPCSRITPQGNGFLARVKNVIALLCLPVNILVVFFFVVPELIFGNTYDSSEPLELGSKRHFVEAQPCSRITPQGNGFLARVKNVIALLCLPANILVVFFFVVPELLFQVWVFAKNGNEEDPELSFKDVWSTKRPDSPQDISDLTGNPLHVVEEAKVSKNDNIYLVRMKNTLSLLRLPFILPMVFLFVLPELMFQARPSKSQKNGSSFAESVLS